MITDPSALHLGAGVALIAFGLFRFVKPRAHFRWVRGTVNRRELTWWSFLMSSAHGAGLMVAPVLIGAGAATDAAASSDHAIAAAQANGLSIPGSALGITLHVAAMLAVMAVVALMVYDHVGVAVLKKAWINLDCGVGGRVRARRGADAVHLMRRARCSRSPAGRCVLADVPEPVAAPGQLKLRVEACGVCRTDLHLRDGELAAGPPAARARPPDRRDRRTTGGGSACRGSAGPAASAGIAARGARTSASAPASPAATSTAATRSGPWPTSASASRCPPRPMRCSSPRCCAAG